MMPDNSTDAQKESDDSDQASEPSEIGATIEAVKKTTEIAPVKALLGPTANLLGEHLKNKVERWLYDKQKGNIQKHAQTVIDKEELESLTDQAQIDLFQWADKAQNVTEDEVELSAAVRASLRETLNNNRENSEILINLTKSEILFIIEKNRVSDYTVKSLIDKGLVLKENVMSRYFGRFWGRSSGPLYILSIVYFMVFVTIFSIIFVSFIPIISVSSIMRLETSGGINIDIFDVRIALVIIIIATAVISIFVPIYRRLTDKGVEIRSLLEVYLK